MLDQLLLAGLGVGEKVREQFDEFVEKGNASEGDCQEKVKQVAAMIKDQSCSCVEQVKSILSSPGRSEFDKMASDLEAALKRIDELERTADTGK